MKSQHYILSFFFALIPLLALCGISNLFGTADLPRFGVKLLAGMLCLLSLWNGTWKRMQHIRPIAIVACSFVFIIAVCDLIAETLFIADFAYTAALLGIAVMGGAFLSSGGKTIRLAFAIGLQTVSYIAAIAYFFGAPAFFDNKVGYASLLLLTIPVVWAYIPHTGNTSRWLIPTILLINVALLVAIGLRGVWIALFAGILILALRHKPRWIKGKRLVVAGFLLLVLSITAVALYFIRPDSADGRLFIYACSARLWFDAPLLGHGSYAVLAHYMPMQAEVLETFPPTSHAAMLADNTFTTFNLPLDLLVRYGIIGLMIVGSLVCLLYRECLSRKGARSDSAIFALTAFGVFSLTSYPLSYPAICALFLLFIGAEHESGILKSENHTTSSLNIIRQKGYILKSLLVSLLGCFLILESTITLRKEHVWTSSDIATRKAIAANLRYRPELLYNFAAALNEEEKYVYSDSVLLLLDNVLCDYDTELLRGDNALWTNRQIVAERHLQTAHYMIPSRFTPLYGLLQLYSENYEERADSVAREILAKPIKVPSAETNRIKTIAKEWLDRNQ